jgi:putative two-component system response regulator
MKDDAMLAPTISNDFGSQMAIDTHSSGPRSAASAESRAWSQPPVKQNHQQIFIVDDEELNIRVARKYLRMSGFNRVDSTTEPVEAVGRIKREQPDLILLDIMMPEISGLDILRELRADASAKHLPVIILTAHVEDEIKREAIEIGANDFLSKPIDPIELLPRVRNLLTLREHQRWLENTSEHLEREVQRRTAALVKAEQNIVNCLARAAEYRDNETGRHVTRVGHYAALIAKALGMDANYCTLIKEAAKLHDVGKIGIPDAILLKTGKLDPEEFQMMQQHCGMGLQVLTQITQEDIQQVRSHVQMGASILDVIDSPLLAMASQIAMTHHEKWDGTGYPFGLKGEQIPLEGRITAVGDVFDALSSRRPYKPAFPLEKCYSILKEGRGTHFEPRVLDAFLSRRDEAVAIQMQYADPE